MDIFIPPSSKWKSTPPLLKLPHHHNWNQKQNPIRSIDTHFEMPNHNWKWYWNIHPFLWNPHSNLHPHNWKWHWNMHHLHWYPLWNLHHHNSSLHQKQHWNCPFPKLEFPIQVLITHCILSSQPGLSQTFFHCNQITNPTHKLTIGPWIIQYEKLPRSMRFSLTSFKIVQDYQVFGFIELDLWFFPKYITTIEIHIKFLSNSTSIIEMKTKFWIPFFILNPT